ncbi:pilin [Collimonas antrihumi]|uniref:pilin n=1 Tax=Collimonas antrihumi TaxID=1940615 RepID=UPI001B8C83B0|nr:prepilin-type N-terminal cleavage/methylation domain-containing protein [Collimonas antrihumi]
MKNTHRLPARMDRGFTLIELMLVVAIIGILAAVVIPAYQNHLKKEKFAEVIAASVAAKSAVEACVQKLNTGTGCDGGTNGIPADATGNPGGLVASVSTKNGVITVVPQAKDGILATDTYMLTPTPGTPLQWSTSGSGCIATVLCK